MAKPRASNCRHPHRNFTTTGLYQHISPPRAVPALKPEALKQWLKEGDVDKLRQLVTDGQGHRLLGERPPVPAARGFLRTLPSLMARQEDVHIAAEDGKADEVASMLDKGDEGARLSVSKDAAGLGLLHKAVLRGHVPLAEMLVEKYPQTVHLRDHEGRTALHYCGASPEAAYMWGLLEAAGADVDVVDRRGNRARHYLNMSKNASGGSFGSLKRIKRQEPDLPVIVTRAHIRKWIHERDLGKLEKLLWAGHGDRLLMETSASPRVRSFLESVPYVMSVIKEAHCSIVTNNLHMWLLRTSPPVPEHVIISKDKNGLTPLHKAAGLGHLDLVKEILSRFPDSHKVVDESKRTPLHYAALHQQDSPVYKALFGAGADEKAVDMKGHDPVYYSHHPHDHIDSSMLTFVPEAPRSHSKLPQTWNWNMLTLAPNAIATNMVPEPLPLPQLPRRIEKPPLPNIRKQPSKINPPPTDNPQNTNNNNHATDHKFNHSKSNFDQTATKFSPYMPQQPKRPSKKPLENSNSKISPSSPTRTFDTSGNKFNTSITHQSPKKNIETSGTKLNTSTNHQSPKKTLETSGTKLNTTNGSPKRSLETSQNKLNTSSNVNVTSPKRSLDASGSKLNTSSTNANPPLSPRRKLETSGGRLNTSQGVSGILSSPTKTLEMSQSRIISTPSVYLSKQPLTTIPVAATAFPNPREFDITQTPPTTFSFSPSTSNRTPIGLPLSRMNTPFNPNISRPRMTPSVPSTAPAPTPMAMSFSSSMPAIPSTAPSVSLNTRPVEGVRAPRVEPIPESVRTPGESRLGTSPTRDALPKTPLKPQSPTKQVPDAKMPPAAASTSTGLPSDKPVRPISPPGTRMHAPLLERWVRNKDLAKLEDALLEGRGPRVLKIMNDSSKHEQFKPFLDRAPGFMEAMKLIHSSASTGNENQFNELTGVYKRIVLARDDEGAQPLHVAVRAGHENVARRILNIFPQGAAVPDWEGRTPLHYAAMCPESDKSMNCYQLLLAYGAPENAKDATGNMAKDYLEDTQPQVMSVQKGTRTPAVDTQGAIVQVAENNSNIAQKLPPKSQNADQVAEDAKRYVAEENTEKLAELILDGYGEKLLGLHSTNPYVQGLLENVPDYIIKIKKVHEAAETGDMPALSKALERRKFVTSRDKDGATPMHKAVLHQQLGVVRYLTSRFPEVLRAQDRAGRTPLHYAAVLPDRGKLYSFLASMGADTNLRDKKGHTALDYQLHHEQKHSHERLLIDLGVDPAMAALDPVDPTAALATSAAGALTLDMLEPDPRNMTFGTDSSFVKNDDLQPNTAHFNGTALQEPLLDGLKEVSKQRPTHPISFLANYLYQYTNKSTKNDPKKLAAFLKSLKKQESSGATTPLAGGRESPAEEVVDAGPGLGAARALSLRSERRLETAGSMSSAVGSTNRVNPTPHDPLPVSLQLLCRQDEFGQSMLHFAAVRAHSRNAFAQILKEAGLSVGQRDMVYRTPRDVALEAALPENAKDIDDWVLHLAMEGDTGRLEELLLDGYDHILDVKNGKCEDILELVTRANVQESVAFLKSVSVFESRRDWIHSAIRDGDLGKVREVLTSGRLAVARNMCGRCALHVAVLAEKVEIVEFIANNFPICLAAGDNLERTPLHYAMAMDNAENLSLVLVKAGAKRVLKDLKGRQPSFYFVNREEIIKLKEEEMQVMEQAMG